MDGAGDRIINNGSDQGYDVPGTISIPPGASLGTEYFTYSVEEAPAVDKAGDLFVFDGPNARFPSEFLEGNPNSQRSLAQIEYLVCQPPGATPYYEYLDDAQAMALDQAGDLYIAGDGGILQIPAGDLANVNAYASCVQPLGSVAYDLPFDGASDLLIADPTNNRVVEVQASTGAAFAISPVVDGKGLNFPNALTLDTAGNLYILDEGNARVVEVHAAQPPALSFATTGVGALSSDSPQIVQLQNVGTALLSFSSIKFPTDFSGVPTPADGATHCSVSQSLDPGDVCNLYVNFVPQTEGDLTEAISITLAKDALGRPGPTQEISVSGSTGRGLLVSAESLSYGSQEIGTASASQQFTLTNDAGTPLTLVGFPITGPGASSFVFGSTCEMTLAPRASCVVHGHFMPTSAGPLTATLHVEHHDAGTTQLIALSGTGLTPATATLSGTSLSFGPQAVGTSSASQEITLTNTGGTALDVTSVGTFGPYALSFIFGNNCVGLLAGRASCTIHGHFTPSTTGPLTATIYIIERGNSTAKTIMLTGTGQ